MADPVPQAATFGTLYLSYPSADQPRQIFVLSTQDGETWKMASRLGSLGVKGRPALAVFAVRLFGLFRGPLEDSPNLVLSSVQTFPPQWQAPTLVPGARTASNPTVMPFQGNLVCAYRPVDEAGLALATMTLPDGESAYRWEHSTLPDAHPAGAPALVVFKGTLYCGYRRSDVPHHLAYASFDPSSGVWVTDLPVPKVRLKGSPAPAVYRAKLHVAYHDAGGDHQLAYVTNDGTAWSDPVKVPLARAAGNPAAVAYRQRLYLFYENYSDHTIRYTYLSDDGTFSAPLPVKDKDGHPFQSGGSLSVFYAP